MKKLVIPLIFAILLAPFAAVRAVAADESTASYARIENEGVYLYKSPDEADGLFALPRSYFVEILGETAQYYYVSYLNDRAEYRAVKGYCKKAEVTPVDYTPQTPFLEYKITVTYSLSGGSIVPDDPLANFTAEAVYYGEFNFGTNVYYYVYREGSFGYVPAKSCSTPDYPVNTEHTTVQTPSNEDSTSGGTAQGNAVRIVLICTLSVFAIGAVYFLFRPQKAPKAPRDPFYDEHENY